MAAVAAAAAAFHDESELVKSFCAKLTPQSEPDSESETMMWGCEIARVVCTVKKKKKELNKQLQSVSNGNLKRPQSSECSVFAPRLDQSLLYNSIVLRGDAKKSI